MDESIEGAFELLTGAVVRPVLAALPHGIRTVSIIPVGDVGLLPLHAMFVRVRPGLAVRYLPTARGIARSRRNELPKSALVVAEPATPGPRPLLHARAEAAAVRAAFAAGHDLVGDAATLEAVTAGLHQHELLHFAVHGENRADMVEASRVMLAHGASLTMARLFDESGLTARLVMLSACETAMLDTWLPDERLGLVLGFLQAGCAGVIGTMWAVGDRSSALLVSRFYAEWLVIHDPARALSSAQAWLMASPCHVLRKWAASQLSLVS